MESNIYNILMVGVGGQGIILASDILTRAAMIAGKDTKKSEIHGMSQRGGSVFSHIRFGKKVHSPTISKGEADILFSLEEMETLRWISYANADTFIVCATKQILPTTVETYPEGVREELERLSNNIHFFDTDTLIQQIGNVKFLNVAMLGMMSGKIDFSDDIWRKAIEAQVPKGTAEENWGAFCIGKSALNGE